LRAEMCTEENKRIALELLEVMSDDFNKARAYLAEDFVWWVPGVGDIAKKLERVVASVKSGVVEPIQLKVTGVTAEGDRVAVEAESYAPLKNGKIYNNQYHFLMLLADGKVRVVREYNDTKHVAEVWG
jgi:ketosteroid isomerase-like protein